MQSTDIMEELNREQTECVLWLKLNRPQPLKSLPASLVRSAIVLMTLVLSMTLMPLRADAQTNEAYPSKAITLVVPSQPGGTADPVARELAQHLSKEFGKPVVVENRPGASGAIGATHVAHAAPDGYTLLIGPVTTMVANPLVTETRYQVERDFRPVGLLIDAELVLVTTPSTGFKTLGDVIQYAKKNPGKLAYGSNGRGASHHLAMEYLQSLAGVELLHVPYQSGAAAEMAMLGGQIQVMIGNTSYVRPHIRSGRMVGLAVASAERSKALPDLPLSSATVAGYQLTTWVGLYAPAGTSDEIVAKLNAATNAFLRDPQNAEALRSKGLEPRPGSPADFLKFQTEEQKKWGKIVSFARAKGRLN